MKTALITGGSSGIGQALTWALAEKHFKIFIVGRDQKKLDATRQNNPDNIIAISADLSHQAGRSSLIETLTKKAIKFDYLVHSAAYEGPLKSIEKMSFEEWRYTHATNLEAPIFLTQKLLAYLNRPARILLISSALAHHPVRNASAYCTSKAALHMLYQCMNLELNQFEIYVGVLLPGIVDTPMQARLRNLNKEDFPDVDQFIDLKRSGQLLSPKKVADYITYVLLQTSNQEFTSKTWDIFQDREKHKHHPGI